MPIPAMIVIACWWLFILFWAAMAFRTKRTVHRQSRREQRPYLWLLLIGGLAMSGLPRFVPPIAFLARPLTARTDAWLWTAAASAVTGLVVAVWARIALGRNWSGTITLKEDHELVTRGPYAAIRHPIYTALILLFVGLALLFLSAGAILGVLLVVWSCWIKLRAEEVLMLQQFPQSYPGYMARTKRLLPGIV